APEASHSPGESTLLGNACRLEQPQLPPRVVRPPEGLRRQGREALVQPDFAPGDVEERAQVVGVVPLTAHALAEGGVVQLAAADVAGAVEHLLAAVWEVLLPPGAQGGPGGGGEVPSRQGGKGVVDGGGGAEGREARPGPARLCRGLEDRRHLVVGEPG